MASTFSICAGVKASSLTMRFRNWVAGLLPPASAPVAGAAGVAAAAGAVAGVVAEADALAGADIVAVVLELAAAVATAGAAADAFGEFVVPFWPVAGVLFA